VSVVPELYSAFSVPDISVCLAESVSMSPGIWALFVSVWVAVCLCGSFSGSWIFHFLCSSLSLGFLLAEAIFNTFLSPEPGQPLVPTSD
jgi:hypothetical protein